MTTFRDPLYRYSEINDANCFEPKIENFLNLTNTEAFHSAISTLVEIRKVLRVANSIGRLGELNYREQFTQAIQWLNKQTPLTNFVSIAQISDYSEIDDSIANNFNSYVNSLNNNLKGQALYQQIQIMQGVIENKVVEDVSSRITAPLQDQFSQHLMHSREDFSESMDKTKQDNEEQITKLYNSQLESIRSAGQNAISEFEQARALANWSDFYAKKVQTYKLMVSGKSWPENALRNKLANFRRYRKSLTRKQRVKTLFQFRSGLLECTGKAASVLFSKATSYSGKRSFWFFMLAFGVFLVVLVNLVAIYDVNNIFGVDLAKLRPTHNDTQLFAKISLYIGVFLIPTIGYSFANKNYRIYSNLLEQYGHREVVAQTIQGILARPRGDDNDEKVRNELANVASTALFEQKTIGHLSKNEANSVSLFDIIKSLRG